MSGAVLGEVGGTIVGDGFQRIRDGDRFWYERLFPASFVRTIKKTTLAEIIMRNSDIRDLQDDVFHYRS